MSDAVTAAAIALASFGLASLRDTYKRYRDRRARQYAVLISYNEEMLANYSTAETTLNLLGFERLSRQRNEFKALQHPTTPLEHGAWPIARVELPSKLLKDQRLMRRLRQINRETVEINSLGERCEHFRIQHLRGEHAFFDQGVEGYTRSLIRKLRNLKREIKQATDDLSTFGVQAAI